MGSIGGMKMEVPSRYYYVALGFLSYVKNNAENQIKMVPDTDSPNDAFKQYKVLGLESITSPEHVKLLEELFKSKNEYL